MVFVLLPRARHTCDAQGNKLQGQTKFRLSVKLLSVPRRLSWAQKRKVWTHIDSLLFPTLINVGF